MFCSFPRYLIISLALIFAPFAQGQTWISGYDVNAGTTNAVVTWTTAVPADSQVQYGPTTAYGSSTALAAARVTAHSVTISNLTPGTNYHCIVLSRDSSGVAVVSLDYPFSTAQPVSIALSPASARVASGATQQFTATVSNTSNTAVTWTASAGTITSGGLFTAPVVSSNTTVTVTATSAADTSKTASATVTVAPPLAVALSPTSVSLLSGGQQQFSASVSNCANASVTWSASAGTISSTGLFTAPSVTTSTIVTVKATSVADSTKSASATVTVNPVVIVAISISPTNVTLNGGGQQQFTATVSGTTNTAVTWSATAGTISPTGLFTAPSVLNNTSVTIAATSVADSTKSAVATVSVVAPAPTPTGFDGPAELPRAYVQSSLSATPAPGRLVSVASGASLQTALNSAQCGDTISLQAGATFSGSFSFPANSCDDNHWIIVRTSAPDSSLPPEGTRLTPCYAGLASYPNRPPYACSVAQNVVAKIVNPTMGMSGPITFNGGHYRLIGLEITRANTHGLVYDLITATTPAANHIILDRVWAHGIEQSGNFPQTTTNSTETKRGLNLGQSNTVAVVDSYFSDFYCDSSINACDSQAIAGGWGSTANSGWGKWKITNNHLEGAAEGVLFGGANGPTNASSDVPCDFEIRRNHFFKPLSWNSGTNNTPAGWPIEKNGLEFKNGCRILFEGNLIENVWYGAQVGQAMVIAPKNQSSSGHGTCSTCIVTDLVVRYNKSYNTASGVGIFNSMDSGCTTSCASLGMFRVIFHDNLHDDINLPSGSGADSYQISTNSGSPMDTLWIVHNTVTLAKRSAFLLGGPAPANQSNFMVRDNIIHAGTYGSVSVGSGGCQGTASTVAAISSTCWMTSTFTDNAIVIAAPGKNWPAGDYYPASGAAVSFVNYNNGNGGDYHLASGSLYKNAATDGADLGANIDAINTLIAGVR